MRKPSRNSIATKVRERIVRGGADRLWTFHDFREFPTLAVAATLSRLSRGSDPLIRRVRRGIYYVPKKTRFGETRPDTDRVVAHSLDLRGFTYAPSGTSAYNGLGLTTQVSPKVTFRIKRSERMASPRTSYSESVTLRPSYAAEGIESSEMTVLDALKDVRKIPDATPAETVNRIVDLVHSGRLSFKRLARLAKHEPARVRALVGAIGDKVGVRPNVTSSLKKSLNPLTSFHLNVGSTLPTARSWQIR